MILVADMGGTKTRIALVEKTIREKIVIPTNKQALDTLVQLAKKHKIKKIGIGAAGPRIGDTITLTNADIRVSKKAIEKKTGATVTLLNDLEALGYSLHAHASTRSLRKGSGTGIKAILSVGTGLGKVVICPACQNSLPSEVSETLLPTRTTKELELVQKVSKEGRYEDVLSSRGVVKLYSIVQKKYTVHKNPTIYEITAMNNPCKREVYSIFATFLARLAKQTILDNCATGGIYLAGGILKHNEHAYIAKFIKEMSDKNEMVANTPIWIIDDENAALKGIAYEVYRKKKSN